VPIVVGRVSDERLLAMLARAQHSAYSYAEVGATQGASPSGYRADHYELDLGSDDVFDRAVDGLTRWQAHRGAGARVVPADAAIAGDQTVLVALAFPVVAMVAPCRIVYVTDESDRFGFAYGTLSGHPDQGEESFHIVRAEGRTRFEISAFSRPAHPLARLGSPVARYLQTKVTKQYLEGLKRFVDSDRT
jgi:uncharacterized protein (UPF0548 family)